MPIESFHCGFCGSDSGVVLFNAVSERDRPRNWLKCLVCGSVSPSPAATPAELIAAYDAEYYGQLPSKFIAPLERIVQWFRSGHARRIRNLVPDGRRLIDIGCGNGNFLVRCRELGFEVRGTELPGRAADRAKELLGDAVYVGPLNQANLPDGSFDVAVLWHVFEHLPDPRIHLEVISRLLKKDGILVVAMPNIDSFQALVFKGSWFHLDPPRHLFLQSPQVLDRVLNEFGFHACEITHFAADQNIFGWIQSFFNLFSDRRDFFYEALKGNLPLQGLVMAKAVFFAIAAISLVPAAFLASLIESAAGCGGSYIAVFRRVT